MKEDVMNTYLICREKKFFTFYFKNVKGFRDWVIEYDLLHDVDNYVIEVTQEGTTRCVWCKERGWLA